jgi:hypothetical protein
LERSRERNGALGVTGLLLYKDGNFLQVLEGEADVVRPLFGKIERDPRHRGIIKVIDEEGAEREFPEWSMGFRDLELEQQPDVQGYSTFMRRSGLREEDAGAFSSKCRKLLALFRQSLR